MEHSGSYYNRIYSRIIEDGLALDSIVNRSRILSNYVRGTTILDIGCGLGILGNYVDAAYTGIDISSVAIDWAKHYTIGGNKTYITHDIMSGEFHKLIDTINGYETVVLSNVIEFIDNKDAMLSVCTFLCSGQLLFAVKLLETEKQERKLEAGEWLKILNRYGNMVSMKYFTSEIPPFLLIDMEIVK